MTLTLLHHSCVNHHLYINRPHKLRHQFNSHLYNSSSSLPSFNPLNMPIALKLRTLITPVFRFQPIQTRSITNSARMSVNEQGQGKSHAVGESAVPKSVQDAAPKGLEEALPDKVRYTSFASHGSPCKVPRILIPMRRSTPPAAQPASLQARHTQRTTARTALSPRKCRRSCQRA